MSILTAPAQRYQKLLPADWVGDATGLTARAVVPVGGTQFVYKNGSGGATTVLEADFAVFAARDNAVTEIDSTTDCTEIHLWF